jgi:hypothetical protein
MTTKAARIKSTTSSAPTNVTKKTDAGINYSTTREEKQTSTEIASIDQLMFFFFFFQLSPIIAKASSSKISMLSVDKLKSPTSFRWSNDRVHRQLL